MLHANREYLKNNEEIVTQRASWNFLFEQGIKHLIAEKEAGFVNTKHAMPFTKEAFQVEQELQIADIFQRALLVDTFLDAQEKYPICLQEHIASELTYLKSAKREGGIGGWGYFPDLKELPPDVDDLAQILQVFCKFYPKDGFKDLFDVPIETILNDQANEDLGWETWILPKENLTKEQQLQYEWIHKAWGTGSDVDVVANFLYALQGYDKKRFDTDIQRGLRFLYNKQHQGGWESTWYYGLYYGTFVSLRAICSGKGDKQVVAKALAFLLDSQHDDGGWSLPEQSSDALQTALALLGIEIASRYLEKPIDLKWLDKSLHFLATQYDENIGWESCPFIKMPMGRPSGFVHTILTYGSSPITNNFVTKACLQFL